jgi:hypothetical protein
VSEGINCSEALSGLDWIIRLSYMAANQQVGKLSSAILDPAQGAPSLGVNDARF